ncbi:13093_t:CDS:2 [Entrophospora sp. SA101]|nr:13093_t:CDS:2 [Entrophospora sp. SA101]
MKFYTGDEVGLIKAITISNLSQKEASPIIKKWGKIDRAQGVQLMYQAKIYDESEQQQIIVARKNGKIHILDPNEEGKAMKEFTHEQISDNKIECVQFVGLFANSTTLVTCDAKTGIITYQPISIDNESSFPITSFSISKDLCRLRVHPKSHNIFGCCGKEYELTIWDVNSYKEGSCPFSSQSKKESKPGLIWKAKNLRNDFLDLRVPVWNTDMQFLNDDATKIVVGTKYNQIRIYDTKVKRRPVLDLSIGEHPVVSLIVGRNLNEILFSNTAGNLFSIDVRTGFAGAVSSMEVDSKSTYLATVSLDRFLRVHEMSGKHNLLQKIYLKQHLTSVLVNDEDEIKKANNDEKELEEIWNDMEEVKSKKKKKKLVNFENI